MQETQWIWKNGEYVKWADATEHVLTHSLHYGGAVFEGIRCYKTEKGPAIFRVKEHMERFLYSMKALQMESPFSVDELCEAVLETVSKNKLEQGYIRPLAYYGYGKMGLNPGHLKAQIIIACWPWGKYLDAEALKVKISKFRRIHPTTTDIAAKISGHYVNSIMASQEIHALGYDEALFLDCDGALAEGPGENLFLIKDNVLLTPDGNTENGQALLKGITRDTVMQLAKDRGIEVREGKFMPEDLFSADEAFLSGTAAEISPILSVDDKLLAYAPGPISKQIREDYMDLVFGRTDKHLDWLSFV